MQTCKAVRLIPDTMRTPGALTLIRRAALAMTGVALVSIAAAQPAPTQADAQSKRRYQVRVMEGALVGAVSHGAGQVSRQLQPVSQNLLLLSGAARARGFVLDGYGVFFDVEIPAMRESALSIMRTFEPDITAMRRTLEQLQQAVQRVPDPIHKTALDQSLRKLEALVVAQGGVQRRSPDDRTVAAADVPGATRETTASTVASSPASTPAPAPIADPNLLYTETVKNALIDAMLEYGGSMTLQPDEWLTVAARDAEGPLSPAENYDPASLILRVKGSDLSAFQAKQITMEEARKRVEVREF
jgi:hypothetical protein